MASLSEKEINGVVGGGLLFSQTRIATIILIMAKSLKHPYITTLLRVENPSMMPQIPQYSERQEKCLYTTDSLHKDGPSFQFQNRD